MRDYHQVMDAGENELNRSRENHNFINRILKKLKNSIHNSNKKRRSIKIILCILILIAISTITYHFVVKRSSNAIIPKMMWYQNEIIYEINVPKFRDSDEDGIGDLQGVVEKLDYLEKNNIQSILLQSSIFNISDGLFELSDRQYGKIQTSDLLEFDRHIGDEEDFEDLMESLAKRNMHLIIDLPLSSTADHRDLSWYGTHTSPPISIANPCLRNKNDLGCDYYKSYKRLPLDFSNKEILDQADSRLRYWLEKKNIDGVRVDLPLAFDSLNNTYSVSSSTIDRWQMLVDEIGERTKPKLLLFDIPSNLQSNLNGQLKYPTSISQFMEKQTIANFWQIVLEKEYPRLGWLDETSQRIFFTIGLLIGGTPIVLYGDELGIKQKYDSWVPWTTDPPYGGFSSCLPDKCHEILSSYDVNFTLTNVKSQEDNDESLLMFFRRLSELRKQQSFRNGILKKGLQPTLDLVWFLRELPNQRGFLIVIHINRFKKEPVYVSFRNLTNQHVPERIYSEYQWPKEDESLINTDKLTIYPGSINIFWWPSQNL